MTNKDLHYEYKKDTGHSAPDAMKGDRSEYNKKGYKEWLEELVLNTINALDKEVMGQDNFNEIINYVRKHGNNTR